MYLLQRVDSWMGFLLANSDVTEESPNVTTKKELRCLTGKITLFLPPSSCVQVKIHLRFLSFSFNYRFLGIYILHDAMFYNAHYYIKHLYLDNRCVANAFVAS